MANARPAGHFWPARASEMAPGDFLAGSDSKFVHKLHLKQLKTWPAKVLWTRFWPSSLFYLECGPLTKKVGHPWLNLTTPYNSGAPPKTPLLTELPNSPILSCAFLIKHDLNWTYHSFQPINTYSNNRRYC